MYIKEGAQQLEQQADLRTRMSGSGSFRSEDIMAGPYGGYRLEDDDRGGYRRSTSDMNVENLLRQQMSLMRELMQMLNAQIVHLRNQMNKLYVKPEKFAGTSSFHSFIAKF